MKRLSPRICGFLLLSAGVLQAAVSDLAEVRFRMPVPETYQLDEAARLRPAPGAPRPEWVLARRQGEPANTVEFGNRIVLQLDVPGELPRVISGTPLTLSRAVTTNVFILQAPDAVSAVEEASRLADFPGVTAAYPVLRRHGTLHGQYAHRSDDPFFVPYFNTPRIDAMWYLENRDYNSDRMGIDLNVLAAWPHGQGEGVTVAVADTGVELHHPELAARIAGAPHFNFDALNTNATPRGGADPQVNTHVWTHGTAVAGFIASERDNQLGAVGVAPLASVASWLIFAPDSEIVSDDRLMEMYQYAADTVSIQNHSWGAGNGLLAQSGPTLLEKIGIENAVTLGRQGLGTVIVRSAGNDRSILARADDDGYSADPNVITVGAVKRQGRVTSFSEPGACVLVAAPGGETGNPALGQEHGLFTLDLVGDRGISPYFFFKDFRFGASPFGFAGTSASAPLVSGVAALVLSVNPNLGYRDVQQILALSSRHGDLDDPDLRTNGAGLQVSHNVGFGIPDAGHAVWLAQFWTNRPPLTTVSMTDSRPLPIPDDGLRLEITGPGVPSALGSIASRPGIGRYADDPTPELMLVDVGLAASVPAVNLTNKGALILRGDVDFSVKIENAARAGAAFAVIYNYSTNVNPVQGGDTLTIMGATEFAPIPAVFIGHSDGEALKDVFQMNALARARIRAHSAERTFSIQTPLVCEHVGVRIQTDHPLRSDLRVTLVSPHGTRSVFQQVNGDYTPGPVDWTFWSTHHYFEGSVGTWKVAVTDQFNGATGSIRSVTLILRGTQITDADHDGLDDAWEMARLGSMSFGPMDDPDGDGFSNAREQAMGFDPMTADRPFEAGVSWWELAGYKRARVAWPSAPRYHYALFGGTNLHGLQMITNLPGTFPETEWLGPRDETPGHQFFYRVYAHPAP